MSSPIGHRQSGGTCWCHAALNGLLMSPLARRVLRERIQLHSPSLFWNYIQTRLSRGNVRSVTNRNVIQSAGLRSPNACVRGGNLSDLYRMYDTVFQGDYKISFRGSSTPKFILLKSNDFFQNRIFNRYVYKLSHAYILLKNTTTGRNHAVAGFIDREGRPKIYDSATDRMYSEDWTTSSFVSHRSMYTTVVYKCGIYVRL